MGKSVRKDVSDRILERNYDNEQEWDQMLDLTLKKPIT